MIPPAFPPRTDAVALASVVLSLIGNLCAINTQFDAILQLPRSKPLPMSQAPSGFNENSSSHSRSSSTLISVPPARYTGSAGSITRDVSGDALVARTEDKWSAQEHAGHLFDLESLWMARVDDLLSGGDTLTVADLRNRRTHEANHNARPLTEILAEFRTARLTLVDRLAQLEPALYSHSMPHPRLQQPMRLVDHLYFVAQHDDHHLAKIWELIQRP